MGNPYLSPSARVTALQHELHERLLAYSPIRANRRITMKTVGICLLVLSCTIRGGSLVPSVEKNEPTLQAVTSLEIPALHAAAPEEIPPPPVSSFDSAQDDTPPSPPPLPSPYIGVYLTALRTGDEEFLRNTIDKLKAAGGPAIIFDVKDAYVFFETSSPLARDYNLVRLKYDLREVLRLAKEHDLYTIARFVAVKDQGLARSVPDTQIRHPKTGKSVGNVWVDPSHQTVLVYNRELLRDLVATNALDEINFDYIRYPTEYREEQVGLTLEEKKNRLEAFLKMAREVIEEEGSKTKIGISTYAILGWDFDLNIQRVAQDFVRFAPYVDIISPMAYPASFAGGNAYYDPAIHRGSRMYSLVKRTLDGYNTLLGEEHGRKLRPWIQGYSASASSIQDEMQAVYDAGLCGFTVWSPSNSYAPLYKAMPAVEQPERCK